MESVVPPYLGSEKENLQFSIARHRSAVLWKAEGLDDEQLRRAMVGSGTTILGLIKHLGAVEYGWFSETFGRPVEQMPFDESDPEADLRIEPSETTEEILEFYRRACRASDAVIAEVPLDTVGRSWAGQSVSMRWVLVHMIEETARHAGHVDVLRELIDGTVGDHNRGPAPSRDSAASGPTLEP